MLRLEDNILMVPLVGPSYAERLSILGIQSVKDLLFHFPSRTEDTGDIVSITELSTSENRRISCYIDRISNFRTRGRKYITTAVVSDSSGKIEVIWFNQPYLTKTLKKGSQAILYGKLNPKQKKAQLYSPLWEQTTGNNVTHLAKITPHYPLTEGISEKWLRSKISYLLSTHKYLLEQLTEDLPVNIRNEEDLIDISTAVSDAHFPKEEGKFEKAVERLAFDELLGIQKNLLKRKKTRELQTGPEISLDPKILSNFLSKIPFKPTIAQLRTITEIFSDMKKSFPANRMVQGDVGCGKTLVAAAVSLPVMKSGYQVAIVAPTGILAKQHFESFQEFYKENNWKIGLITGKTKASGIDKEYDLIIGTHAIFHRYENLINKLGLIIIDEQHRFGVKQRETLSKVLQKHKPHKITMTATPIPRSMALSLFGDQDISIIDEMPPGRKPTTTHVVPHSKRKDSFSWIEDKVAEGNQVFWICPLIEDSEIIRVKSATKQFEELSKSRLGKFNIKLLHGRKDDAEKNSIINSLLEKKTNILVSTSVIEVGIDIPDANIIVIEGAERFGLAQLHQLRGRVGRRKNKDSWCFLFPSKGASSEAKKRLEFFSKQDDGLKVAEYDLKRRGPGEVYGTKQSGIPNLKFASLLDLDLIKRTRRVAEKIMSK